MPHNFALIASILVCLLLLQIVPWRKKKQLLILSRLRKMELIVKTEVEAMTIHYDIETDGLF